MLEVLLYGQIVGSIGFTSTGISSLTFDEDYLADARRPTLSQSMLDRHGEPRAPRRSQFGRLPAFFSNLLPEGRLRTYLAERADIDERDEYSLIAALGEDLPGALTIHRDGEEARSRPRSALPDGDPLRFSLAGVQLKFSALGNDDSKGLTIPARGVGGNWIVKLPLRRFDRLPEAENAAMTFAGTVGIDVPEHRLVPVTSIRGLPRDVTDELGNAYAVKRYDRTGDGGLIHQEDFAQVLSAYPNEKYKLPKMVPIAAIIAEACGHGDAQDFVRRLVFNIGIGNGDVHIKNVSLFYPDGRTPRLSPGYDFVPTSRYISDDSFAIPIVRAKRWEAIAEDEFAELAALAGLSRHATIATVRDTAERMRGAWPAMRETAGFDEATIRLIERHLNTLPLLGGKPILQTRSPRARRGHKAG